MFAPRPRRSNTCDCSWKTTLLLLVLVPLGLAALIFVILLGAGIVTTDSLGITEPQGKSPLPRMRTRLETWPMALL